MLTTVKQDYFPLSFDNAWQWRDESGKISTAKLSAKTVVDGIAGYELLYDSFEVPFLEPGFYAKSKDGNFLRYCYLQNQGWSEIFYFPLICDASWKVLTGNASKEETRKVSQKKNFIISGTNYNDCYIIEIQQNWVGGVSRIILAPNVGPVQVHDGSTGKTWVLSGSHVNIP